VADVGRSAQDVGERGRRERSRGVEKGGSLLARIAATYRFATVGSTTAGDRIATGRAQSDEARSFRNPASDQSPRHVRKISVDEGEA
jgi:hypothetical protein